MKVLILVLIGAALILGIYWGMWQLWCFVLPKLWVDGPKGFTEPGFWLFSGAWFLAAMFGKAIFGGSKS